MIVRRCKNEEETGDEDCGDFSEALTCFNGDSCELEGEDAMVEVESAEV